MMTEPLLYNILELVVIAHLPDPGYLASHICYVSIDSVYIFSSAR